MAYSIEPSKDGDYIELKITGDFTGVQMMEYIIEAHAMGKELNINRYLVHAAEARNTDSVIANYDFAYSHLNDEAVNPNARVAALISPDDRSHDFAQTVLSNAGAPIRFFSDLDAALAFLFKKSPADSE